MLYWGKHLVLNVKNANGNVRNATAIYNFTKELVKKIDMKAYGEPQIIHFGSDNKKGYTLVQLIETSNITGHFCDDSGDFYMDVFSCKDFSELKVREMIHNHFQPERIDSRTLYRDTELR